MNSASVPYPFLAFPPSSFVPSFDMSHFRLQPMYRFPRSDVPLPWQTSFKNISKPVWDLSAGSFNHLI